MCLNISFQLIQMTIYNHYHYKSDIDVNYIMWSLFKRKTDYLLITTVEKKFKVKTIIYI